MTGIILPRKGINELKKMADEGRLQAVRLSVPAGTEELNLKALQQGLEYAEKAVT